MARLTTDLAPRFLRLGRAFDLLGDGDPVAGLDQPRQIGFGGMDRHAAHRDRRAVMLAARGQRDVEAGRGDPGVVEEQFEEVAHPVEEQRPLGLRLQRQILRHHRRRGRAERGARHPFAVRQAAPGLRPTI